MAEEKRMSRMISLRISDEEYEKFKQLYRSHGARSISDFARLSMQRAASIEQDPLHSGLVIRIDNLSARIEALELHFSKCQMRNPVTK